MKTVSKTNKKAIIIGSVLLFLLIVGITLIIVFSNVDNGSEGGGGSSAGGQIQLLPGESSYLGVPVAYPRIPESQITYINVENKHGIFDMARWPDSSGSFWFGYGEKGATAMEMVQYIPPIVDADSGFDYESLYAIENNDGFGKIHLLTYLCSAIGGPYFSERISLPSGEDSASAKERSEMLLDYGFGEDEVTRVSFYYGVKGSNGKFVDEKSYTVYIGGRPLTGSGFYFMVSEEIDVLDSNGNPVYVIATDEYGLPKTDEDGNPIFVQQVDPDGNPVVDSEGNPVYKKETTTRLRNHIYYTNVNYFEYALRGFNAFIKGTLVSAGLPEDSTFEPYLTTDFKQWLLEEHVDDGEIVTAGSTVLCKADFYGHISSGAGFTPLRGYDTLLSFDLEAMKEHPDYDRIVAALVGKEVGVYYDPEAQGADAASRIYITLISELQDSDGKLIDFSEVDSATYRYTVRRIDAVIGEWGEIMEVGTPIGSHSLIKVQYSYSVNGGTESSNCYAVIDLNDPLLPTDVKQEIASYSIGNLDTPIEFTVEYTMDSSNVCREEMILSDIVAVYDSKGAIIDKITESSYVTICYYKIVDGKKTDIIKQNVSMADLKDGGEKSKKVYEALIGKEITEGLNKSVYSSTYHYELMREYITYSISEIRGYVESEYVVAFRFVNASERDPFYGETYYKNTLPGDHKHKLYGLNASACENVVAALGGVGKSGSTTSAGIAGECVAVGLTPENLDKYGLYAHKIYFELPRGIYERGTTSDDPDALAEYGWYDTLGFTLYISDEQADGTRYIGSDMYDLIAKVDGANFEFLEYTFTEFWARKSPVLIDVKNLDGFRIEFEMEDLKGDYNFDIQHRDLYVTADGKLTYDSTQGVTKLNQLVIGANIVDGEDYTDTLLYQYILEKQQASNSDKDVGITSFYDDLYNSHNKLENNADTKGVANFKETFHLLQLIRYQGSLTEEEQTEAFANAPRVMRLHVKLSSYGTYYYTYDFYRVDDRRIMVSMYTSNASGEMVGSAVSDFYITHFAFKKLVNGFLSFLNGEIVDISIAYPDEHTD